MLEPACSAAVWSPRLAGFTVEYSFSAVNTRLSAFVWPKLRVASNIKRDCPKAAGVAHLFAASMPDFADLQTVPVRLSPKGTHFLHDSVDAFHYIIQFYNQLGGALGSLILHAAVPFVYF